MEVTVEDSDVLTYDNLIMGIGKYLDRKCRVDGEVRVKWIY